MSEQEQSPEYERLIARTRALAMRLTNDAWLVDEIVQDVRVAIYRNSFRNVKAPCPFLKALVRNRICKALRKADRFVSLEDKQAETLAASDPSPDELCATASGNKALFHHLMKLPEHYRVVLVKRYYENLSPGQIAEELKVKYSTVNTRLQRAREVLAERLGDADAYRGLALLDVMLAAHATSSKAQVAAWGVGASLHRRLLYVAASLVMLATTGAWLVSKSASGRPNAAAVPGALAGSPKAGVVLAVMTGSRQSAAAAGDLRTAQAEQAAPDDSAPAVGGRVIEPEPTEWFEEDFSGASGTFAGPGCSKSGAVATGFRGWMVANLRWEDCPSDPGCAQLRHGEARLFGNGLEGTTRGEEGNATGYIGLFRDIHGESTHYTVIVDLRVNDAEDPELRPVGRLDVQSINPDLFPGEEACLGWQAERGQILHLVDGSPGRVSAGYELTLGQWHTVELTCTEKGSELRAWPRGARRPAEPLAVGRPLGAARRLLFRGPNYRSFDFSIGRVQFSADG
jgi:RNA polymerase sigma-70 factor (ECF subfamily)